MNELMKFKKKVESNRFVKYSIPDFSSEYVPQKCRSLKLNTR